MDIAEAKPGGVGVASQPWIPTGERSGLQTLTATTEIFSTELVFMPLKRA